MSDSALIHVLAAVRPDAAATYQDQLAPDAQLRLTVVGSVGEARALLSDSQRRTDVLVLDSSLAGAFELIKDLRLTYPRLLILLVDDEADFGMPGEADDVSVTPFQHDDLLKRIKRLIEERRLETLRADALPPVRAFAKSLRRAGPGQAKQQAAVEAIRELGYDYVAYYLVLPTAPPEMSLGAQVGATPITAQAPHKQPYEGSLAGWVAQNGQSRIVSPGDEPNHPFVRQQRFGAGACVPVGTTLRFGVILACREQPNSITQQNILMLELVSAQLASALAKESRG